ncbi:uncharacterized protein LOC133186342 [Saccostrea echinata]|uniref:uncharacterized protein LOC133186342 n=1 Tax=Saccostrea echinata TaxID=191078 RepID=UPI002A7FC17D|nr:uncharacterized protein LOC133186342 [Saccostrea echinata]
MKIQCRSNAVWYSLICWGVLLCFVYYQHHNFSNQITSTKQNFKKFDTVQKIPRQVLLPPQEEHQHTGKKDKRYSQVKQDEVVFEILRKERGFFVDIGAHDGEFLSNTLWLERQHGWTGLLIEGNPEFCEKIDKLKRNAWRLCACLARNQQNMSFIKGGNVGGVAEHINEYHMKMLDRKNTITVPCFSLEEVLDTIGVHHIDFYSLDVEGAEMAILQSMKPGLKSRVFTVDVWSIEYRVWDGHQIVVDESKKNLKALRDYFKEIGGYFEHSQLSTDSNNSDGYALDVVFVRTDVWCKSREKLPDGTHCP